MSPNDHLLQFIDEIIKEKFADTEIPEESLQTMKQELLGKLDQMVLMEFLSYLSPDQLKTFEELTDKETPNEEIQAFFTSAIPDQNQVLTTALSKFRELYVGGPVV